MYYFSLLIIFFLTVCSASQDNRLISGKNKKTSSWNIFAACQRKTKSPNFYVIHEGTNPYYNGPNDTFDHSHTSNDLSTPLAKQKEENTAHSHSTTTPIDRFLPTPPVKAREGHTILLALLIEHHGQSEESGKIKDLLRKASDPKECQAAVEKAKLNAKTAKKALQDRRPLRPIFEEKHENIKFYNNDMDDSTTV